jgi:antitoxin component YwqK of YwqJK toxin-antitoxin module
MKKLLFGLRLLLLIICFSLPLYAMGEGVPGYVNDGTVYIQTRELYPSGNARVQDIYQYGKAIAEQRLASNGTVLSTSGKIPDGKVKIFYPGGQLKWVFNYKNNLSVGEAISYYETGEIKSRVPYINGMINGVYTTYYQNGKVFQELAYKNQLQYGVSYAYFENGLLMEEARYANDKLNGHNVIYYEDGTVKQEGDYLNGQKSGTWKFFNVPIQFEESNNVYYLTGEYTYVNGLGEGPYKYYDPQSKVVRKSGQFHLDKLEGVIRTYYPSGALQYKDTYKNGVKISRTAYTLEGAEKFTSQY